LPTPPPPRRWARARARRALCLARGLGYSVGVLAGGRGRRNPSRRSQPADPGIGSHRAPRADAPTRHRPS